MKVVIPVAGLGTRMLPATKVIPKEMLTIYDRPMIQYIVEECASAGIKEIIFVTHSSKSSIENHFDTSYELEHTLEKRVKRQLLDEVRSITPPGVTIIHVRQGNALGLGHAISCARPIVGNEPFAVVLPDVLLAHFSADQTKYNLAYMIRRYNQTRASQILVSPVSMDAVSQYGIVKLAGEQQLEETGVADIERIVEKPTREQAPSNLSVVGRYVFHPSIWPILDRTPLGVGGEIQLSDAIDMLIAEQKVEAVLMRGRSFDCGSREGYFEAFVEYAMRHPKDGRRIGELVDKIHKSRQVSLGDGESFVEKIFTRHSSCRTLVGSNMFCK